MSGTGGSTGNLKRHLLNHQDKINNEVKKQAEMLEKFLNSNEQSVCIWICIVIKISVHRKMYFALI